jgi:hypothetical protein
VGTSCQDFGAYQGYNPWKADYCKGYILSQRPNDRKPTLAARSRVRTPYLIDERTADNVPSAVSSGAVDGH